MPNIDTSRAKYRSSCVCLEIHAHVHERDREYRDDYFAMPLSSALEIGIISDYR